MRKTMKRLILFLVVFLSFSMMNAQTLKTDSIPFDSIKQTVQTINDKVAGIEERLTTAENDLAKATKLKISGYIQAQWINNEASNVYPNNLFQVRRARIKFTYEPVNGVVFVLQPDFQPGNITIKDAYIQLNDPWIKTFSLWGGKFNRPNYEVEYSSSSREVPERSRIIRAIYPDERAIGAKIEIHPERIPLKFQFAIFNGNEGISTPDANGNYSVLQNTDYDNHKDLMARLTYTVRFKKFATLTIGAHGYYGGIKGNSTTTLKSDYTFDKTTTQGQILPKQWGGVESQLYLDLWGGLAIKGEYITGINSTPGVMTTSTNSTSTASIKNDTLLVNNVTTKTNVNTPSITKSFAGWYVYGVKNIGKKHQFAVRYDYFDPNTKLINNQIGTAKYDASKTTNGTPIITYAGNSAVSNQTNTVYTSKSGSGTADLAYGTWTLAYSYYFTDNIKIMLGYEIPTNEKANIKTSYVVNGNPGSLDYNNVINQNTLTLRLQVKF